MQVGGLSVDARRVGTTHLMDGVLLVELRQEVPELLELLEREATVACLVGDKETAEVGHVELHHAHARVCAALSRSDYLREHVRQTSYPQMQVEYRDVSTYKGMYLRKWSCGHNELNTWSHGDLPLYLPCFHPA